MVKTNDYSANDYRFYLTHHGIPGQKWGVKNGPPYPLKGHSSREIHDQNKKLLLKKIKTIADPTDSYFDCREKDFGQDKILSKGSKMYRVSSAPNEHTTSMKYVSYNNDDINEYQNQKDSLGLGMFSIDDFRTHEYTATDDLVIAGTEVTAKAVLKYYKMNNTFKKEDYRYDSVETIWDTFSSNGIWQRLEKANEGITVDKVRFDLFDYGKHRTMAAFVLHELYEQGYDAVTDVFDKKCWGRGS